MVVEGVMLRPVDNGDGIKVSRRMRRAPVHVARKIPHLCDGNGDRLGLRVTDGWQQERYGGNAKKQCRWRTTKIVKCEHVSSPFPSERIL